MTKKFFFALALVAAAFVSCNKQEVAEPSANGEGGLVVNVTVPETKLTYTDEGTSGLDLTFQNEKDRLLAYFRNSGGSMVGSQVTLNLDPASLSLDKKSATFKASSDVTIPATASSIFFYLDNEDNGMYDSISWAHLLNQGGKLEDAAKLQVIVGSANVADMTEDANGNKVADINFEYKTSVLKLELTFPAEVVPTADENTTITITDPDVYNDVRISWGNPHTASTKGAISVHPSSVSGQVATAYVTVWGTSVFEDAVISADVNGAVCTADFTAAATLAAGKVYSVKRSLSVPSLDKWTNDAAGSGEFLAGLSVSDNSTDGWLSYSAGTGAVSWTANATGAPRAGTITFTNGAKAKVSQLEANDFKGTWDFRSKRFAGSNKLSIANANDCHIDVTFGSPLSGDTLDDSRTSSSITNNIGVSGLFATAIMDAAVIIDYEAKDVKFGLFADARSAQSTSTGDDTFKYVYFAPELGGSFVGGTYNFLPYPLGTSQNYGWIWFAVNDTFDVLTFNKDSYHTWGVTGAQSGKTIVGITVVASSAETPASNTLRSTANGTAGYELIYQANATYGNTGVTAAQGLAIGMTFTRK